jgi:hypothetical protein
MSPEFQSDRGSENPNNRLLLGQIQRSVIAATANKYRYFKGTGDKNGDMFSGLTLDRRASEELVVGTS